MTATTKNKYWITCPHCGHKLMKCSVYKPSEVSKGEARGDIEIKCHSCKTIATIRFVEVERD